MSRLKQHLLNVGFFFYLPLIIIHRISVKSKTKSHKVSPDIMENVFTCSGVMVREGKDALLLYKIVWQIM